MSEEYYLAGALLDGPRACIVVEVGLDEARDTASTLIPSGSNSISMAIVNALRAVLDAA
jgi:hypothetical protein